jgi:RNA polymerase sigma factor (sigma-70 family)
MDPLRMKELYEKYGFLIYGRCIRILGSEDDARDAMHEVFLKLLDNINRFTDREHIIPWIYTVTRNHCFNILRGKKKFVHTPECDGLTDGMNGGNDPLDRLLIGQILAVHNKRVQEAVYFTYMEKLNQKEIQKITGQSPATIRRNLNRFKKSMPHLKKRLGIE